MVSKKTLATVTVGTIGVGVGLYFLYNILQGKKTFLTIQILGSGGTTDPAPGTYEMGLGESTLINALPTSGYYVDEWTVDDVTRGSGSALPLWMDDSHTVTVAFTTEPPPPPTQNPPAQIRNLTVPTLPTWKQKYQGFWSNLETSGWEGFNFIPIVGNYAVDYTSDYTVQTVKFEVLDAFGAALSNIPVLLSSGPTLDYFDATLYVGNARRHNTANFPALLAYSNSKGIVSAAISYRHLYPSQLSKERCYNKRWYIGSTWTECLVPGKTMQFCTMFIRCTGEENGIAMNSPCPNPTQYGPQYEYESVPQAHVITATATENPAATNQLQVQCWYGVKNVGWAGF